MDVLTIGKRSLGKKPTLLLFIAVSISALFSTACNSGGGRSQPLSSTEKISTLSQLDDPRFLIGGSVGTLSLREGEAKLPNARFKLFPLLSDAYLALEMKKIDAVVYDRPPMEYVVLSRPNLIVLPENIAMGHIAVGAPLKNKALVARVNDFIRQYRSDGTYDEMYERWVKSKNLRMPDIPVPKFPTETVVIGCDCQNEPMTFMTDNGRVSGFDIEFVKRLTLFLNVDCEMRIMDYEALFPAVASEKIDLAVANIDASEEREETMLFSDDYIESPISVMIRKSDSALHAMEVENADGDFVQWFAGSGEAFVASFNRTFIREGRWKLIVDGLKTTIIITVAAAILGTLLAFGVCSMRRSSNVWLRYAAKTYIALMQGMPMLVILMILYYVVFARVDLDAIIVAVIGFAMNFSVYVGEMMRAAIDGIPKGQYEAAMALGFKRSTAFRKIIFPQVLRRILPVYRGEFINMLKMTSIVGYIAIQDLTKMSDIIRGRTYEAFFPLIATAIIYFVVAHLLASVLSVVEFRLDPRNRRTVKGGNGQ